MRFTVIAMLLAGSALPLQAQVVLSMGGTVGGGALRRAGESQAYSVQCVSGVPLSIDLDAGAGSVRLVLVDRQGQERVSESRPVRIVYVCPDGGVYRATVTLMATAYTGFTLRVTQGLASEATPVAGASAQQAMAPAPQPAPQPMASMPMAPQPMPMAPPAGAGTLTTVGTIGLNQRSTGVLTTNDVQMGRRRPVHFWAFQCVSGLNFQVDVQGAWDNYVIILDATNRTLAQDDDSGGNLNARLQHTCAESALYKIGVTTNGSLNAGPYTLTVQQIAAVTMASPQVTQPQPIGQPQPMVSQPQPMTASAGADGMSGRAAGSNTAAGSIDVPATNGSTSGPLPTCPARGTPLCQDPSGLQWRSMVFNSMTNIPEGATRSGEEPMPGPRRYFSICRVYFQDGRRMPGKVGPGFEGCKIGMSGNEQTFPSFEILMGWGSGVSSWLRFREGNALPSNTLAGFQDESGAIIGVCRGRVDRTGTHIGYYRRNTGCTVGYGGRQVTTDSPFELLVSGR